MTSRSSDIVGTKAVVSRTDLGFRIIGTAFVSGGLLVFQILSSRLLGLVLDGSVIIMAIAIAMLGMGVATSLVSIRSRNIAQRSSRRLAWIGIATGLSYVLSLLLVANANDAFNRALESAVGEGGLSGFTGLYTTTVFSKMGIVGGLLFIPYFMFGLFIAELFASVRTEDYHRVYAADLIGAAVGCVLSAVMLDLTGYAGTVALILFCTFAGAAGFGVGTSRAATNTGMVLAVVVLVAVPFPAVFERLEPEPQVDAAARNFDRNADVGFGWHVWNAQSRVGFLALTDLEFGERREVYVHEGGDGWAIVPDFDRADLTSNSPVAPLTMMFEPKRVLVLFAGVGADMVAIDAACGGACDITGVEINRHMVDHALATGDPRLSDFLGRDNIHLEVAEAREFLERDETEYDVILLSWWGAGVSQYVGSAGRLSQYLYTEEAFAALVDHLTPNGIVISYNGSKAQTLVTLRALFAESDLGSLAEDVAILRADSAPLEVSGVLDVLEKMRLVLKPSGFEADDVDTLRAKADELGLQVILSPEGVDPGFDLYRDIVTGVDLDTINAGLRSAYDVELTVTTDNRPFMDQLVPRSKYLDVGSWFDGAVTNAEWFYVRGFIRFTLALSAVSLVLILGPLLFRTGPRRSRENAVNLVYFAALGAGFIAVEVGMVRKFGLVLGHPSYAISIVLAALILSTGVGSLLSSRIRASGFLTERRTAALIGLYVVALTMAFPVFAPTVIGLPVVFKACVTVALLFPLGFLMGQMFPWGLERAGRADANAVPWAWAINNAFSTIGSAVALLLSFPLGFDSILLLGAATYAVILLLPLGHRTSEDGTVHSLA
jgi:hypothetical protein